MNSFLNKFLMLIFFLVSVTSGWAAITMIFSASLYNILLAIVSAFFLLRALELADKINKFGPYSEEAQNNDMPETQEEETPKEE